MHEVVASATGPRANVRGAIPINVGITSDLIAERLRNGQDDALPLRELAIEFVRVRRASARTTGRAVPRKRTTPL